METKHHVYNLIILDESGSMNSIKNTIISGFNEIVQTVKGVAAQFPEQAHYISLVSFNGLGIKTHLSCAAVEKLDEINGELYRPSSSTPLFDAMGEAITALRQTTDTLSNCNVLVTIMTDGMENASKEYNKAAIKALVDELGEKNWTFTYIGADHDIESFAESISIKNTMRFEKNLASMSRMFASESRSRAYYSQKIREGRSTKENFYSEGDE